MKTIQGFVPSKKIYNSAQIDQIVFSVLAPEQMQSWSIMQVTESKIYEGIHPNRGGVNDSRLGISRPGQKCETCGQMKNCFGHFGHIKLAEPVYHIGFLKYVVRILKCICLHCSQIKYFKTEEQKLRFEQIVRIASPMRRMLELSKLLGNISKCPLVDENGQKFGCGGSIPTKFTIKQKMRLLVTEKDEAKNIIEVQYSASKVRNILSKINSADCKILGFTQSKPANLILTLLPVAPPQVRPAVQMGAGRMVDDDITIVYSRIIAFNNQIKQGLNNYNKTDNVIEIQKLVAVLMVKIDKKYIPELKNKRSSKNKASLKIKSLEERLIAKDGRFRQHLMGKRVDFCARTVITPDPFIALEQIGIPQTIASALSFPEMITEFNYERIHKLCKAGKVRFLVNPSLLKEKPQMSFIYLNKKSSQQVDKLVRIGMIAQRQLENGDYVLFNRQPTLHRMSMMGHKVKILPHNTFRLNLSVCSPYNADFDGDQMNVHVPQSIQSVAELQLLASVPNQIMNPKNSTPIMGIVQDSLLGIYLMTMRDTFITWRQLMNLVMWMDPLTKFEQGDLPMPCIIKPQPLWSGKQVISMIIPEKTTFKMNLSAQTIRNFTDKQNLVIRNGEILSGILKKDHVGPGCGKLIQAIWLQKGPEVACSFITNIQKVVTSWLMDVGFSVGFADIIPSQQLQVSRKVQIQDTKRDYYTNNHIYRNLPKYHHQSFHQKGKKVAQSLQFRVNLDLNNSLSRMQTIVLNSVSSQKNNIRKMIDAQSKGSQTNMAQIMFCLGNQNVDGQRCPQGFTNRALPHFPKSDNSPQPRGFVFSSFFHGLKPHQFFFHSMAGREGLSDTAVKTSNIGYIQRKLVKALEDLSVRYDGTVRDSKDNILQRFYGYDGFQPQFIEKQEIKSCLLSLEDFEKMYRWNQKQIFSFNLTSQQLNNIDDEYVFLLDSRNLLRNRAISQGQNAIYYYCPVNIQRLVDQQIQSRGFEFPVNTISPGLAIKMVEQLANYCVLPPFRKSFDEKTKKLEEKQKKGKISKATAYQLKKELLKEYGCEIFHVHLKFWLSSKIICNKYKFNESELETLINKVKSKFRKAISPAGQAIGSLAAQSIGQPTTQMTLNTFHLAGVADRNVTLGIPRLRELLNASKDIRTPYITIYPKYPLYWQDRQNEESQMIQNTILQLIPERSLRYYIAQTGVYFDPGKKESNLDKTPIGQLENIRRTPWVLIICFEKEKITSLSTWRLVLKTLSDNLGKEFDITEYVGIGEIHDPQIQLRLNPQMLKLLGQGKTFKHLATRQIQLQDYPLSGIKGVSSVKIVKKRGFSVREDQKLVLDLQQSQDELIFEAIGSNLKQLLSHPFIDSQRTVSNSLKEVFNTLGIEAARECFLLELKEVLKPYNITISHRHLDILVDWMTFRGNLTPINRHGINRVKDVSVLRKATFQETIDVLYDAAVFSEVDQLRGVSEKIIFAQKLNIGTNICKIYLDQKKVGNYAYQPKTPLTDFIMQKNQQKEQQDQLKLQGCIRTPKRCQSPKRLSFSPQNSFTQAPITENHASSRQFTESRQASQSVCSFKPAYSALQSPSYSGSSKQYRKLTQVGDSSTSHEIPQNKSFGHKRILQRLEKRTFLKQLSESPRSYTHSQLSNSPAYLKEGESSIASSKPIRPKEGVQEISDESEED